ncbi:MAG TPA: hypothetical protein VGS03_08745 [Candidatus Polarisedimenticolia bacterium]|jgi:hypothetical protein|nr:hypothetical protein [Candidatus Polarisedimenticolia bacterium]
MGSFAKRLVLSALGVVVMLGSWTVKGWFVEDANATMKHIPDKVWDGGGGTITVETDSTEAARVYVSFETNVAIDDAGHKFLETWERVEPGFHAFRIEVPPGVSGTAEVDVENPKVGSKARVAVRVNGEIAIEDKQELTEPLKPGWAFAAQVELEDYAKGTPGND